MPADVFGRVAERISPCVYVVMVDVHMENYGLNTDCETMVLVEVDYLSVQ